MGSITPKNGRFQAWWRDGHRKVHGKMFDTEAEAHAWLAAVEPPKPPRVTTIQHGTRQAYDAHHCRCEQCRTARNERQRAKRARRRARFLAGEIEVNHGGYSAYLTGCRCEQCRPWATKARRKAGS